MKAVQRKPTFLYLKLNLRDVMSNVIDDDDDDTSLWLCSECFFVCCCFTIT